MGYTNNESQRKKCTIYTPIIFSMRPVARPRLKSKPDEQKQQQQQAKPQPQQHRQQQQQLPAISTTRPKPTKPLSKSSTNSCQTQ